MVEQLPSVRRSQHSVHGTSASERCPSAGTMQEPVEGAHGTASRQTKEGNHLFRSRLQRLAFILETGLSQVMTTP